MIRKYQVTVDIASGTTTGSARTSEPVNGEIIAVHLNYTDIAAATCDVTIKTLDPEVTVLSVADNVTDGWYYPRVQMQNTSGTALTYDGTRGVYDCIAVADYLNVSVAQGDAGSVIATIIVES